MVIAIAMAVVLLLFESLSGGVCVLREILSCDLCMAPEFSVPRVQPSMPNKIQEPLRPRFQKRGRAGPYSGLSLLTSDVCCPGHRVLRGARAKGLDRPSGCDPELGKDL